MADHSQKWYDGATSKKMESSNSSNGLVALVNKLDNLGRDMKKLKQSVHTIQVGCQICEGPHLNKDCPLSKEKKIEEEAYIRQAKQDEWLEIFCHNLEKNQKHHDDIIQGLKSRVRTLARETITDKNENCKAIFTNDGDPLCTPFYYSPEEIEYLPLTLDF
ncbi:hypothetical protein Tco_1095820 [Tanacetum coccineum]